jgi:protein Tex
MSEVQTTASKQVQASIVKLIAEDIKAKPEQVIAAIQLLDEGATVPFISRYRKEVTGGLDDTQLRNLEERLGYLRELEDRRIAVIESVEQQGKMTPVLLLAMRGAMTKQELEDLYLPYKVKRRTRAQIAKELGLEPLADALLADPNLDPQEEAKKYFKAADEKGEGAVVDAKTALDGARDILAERFAEQAEVLAPLREQWWNQGFIVAKVVEGKQIEGEKFRDYFDHSEALNAVPSHRALALYRGRQAGILTLKIALDETQEALTPHPFIIKLGGLLKLAEAFRLQRKADAWLAEVTRWTWRVKLYPHFETELFGRVREQAEAEAIRVFGANLKDLMLAAPAGPKVVMGLDPGIRTGVKVAVVDATGKVLDTSTIYPHEPRRDWQGSLYTLAALVQKHGVNLIAIGNGTASRETEKLAAELIAMAAKVEGIVPPKKAIVSEAGASVYSASELAAKEFPDLDVSLRGAVSIARRLQDPLAELVKIDPKAIGVGQYQHDVNQRELAKRLDAIVEDCVNAVGVDVNTASAALLARVSGMSNQAAQRVVGYRDQHGAFQDRLTLKEVPYISDKVFEQAAGFLRISNGKNPLDASAVHPEAYPVVERILAKVKLGMSELMSNPKALAQLKPLEFSDEKFGEPTVKDIFKELEKPGRDPRGEFKTASFAEGVEGLGDLKVGMKLQGTVTNVANFGAFVDIGVHQDGLVHISQLSDKFVSDPREAVKVGQVVTVTVVEVDIPRKRIALTLKSGPLPSARIGDGARVGPSGGGQRPQDRGARTDQGSRNGNAPRQAQPLAGGFGAALADALKKR